MSVRRSAFFVLDLDIILRLGVAVCLSESQARHSVRVPTRLMSSTYPATTILRYAVVTPRGNIALLVMN